MASNCFLRYQFLSFGTPYPRISFFQFSCRGLAWKGDIIHVCAEILYREGFTWDVAFFILSRTYFAASAVFHSFLALKERRTQDLTKTLYMARRRRRILSFTVTEGAELQRAAGGTVMVHWRLLVSGCRATCRGAVLL